MMPALAQRAAGEREPLQWAAARPRSSPRACDQPATSVPAPEGLVEGVSIEREVKRERSLTVEEVLSLALSGETDRAAGNLLFHTEPSRAPARLVAILDGLDHRFDKASPAERAAALRFALRLAIDLRSFLPQWSLAAGLPADRINALADAAAGALGGLAQRDADAAAAVRSAMRRQVLSRLAAEAVTDRQEAEAEADRVLGTTLIDAVEGIARGISTSNLTEIAHARFRGETTTEFGNDYAVFLQDVIWRGGSFVTTNPVLIKVAWDTDPELWNRRVDELILGRYDQAALRSIAAAPAAGAAQSSAMDAAVAAICSAVTMAVVLDNCRLLRDIFLVTGGREGNVSLQVNPRLHDDAARMAEEAQALHRELTRKLGGVPNVVFKLPSTAAGLEAAGRLGAAGVGVTITLTFSVLQATSFAAVLRQSKAPVSYIAIMNGRLAFPVRDELAAAGVDGGAAAARFAGVEVARKACRRLYSPADAGGLGVDPARVKIMIASLRDYNDWFPDLDELWGVPLITIFPNIRRAYDKHARPFAGSALMQSTPADALGTLARSEIFRQAWWTPGDPEGFMPAAALSLESHAGAALAGWAPMAQTLKQFIELYDQMGELVRGRVRALAAV
jgi:transaldolase